MAPEEKVAYIGQLPGQYYLSKLTDEEIKLIEVCSEEQVIAVSSYLSE